MRSDLKTLGGWFPLQLSPHTEISTRQSPTEMIISRRNLHFILYLLYLYNPNASIYTFSFLFSSYEKRNIGKIVVEVSLH